MGSGLKPRTTGACMGLFLSLGCAALPNSAAAWIYPEHREIALIAVTSLHSEDARRMRDLWQAAREGHEDRLCPSPAQIGQGVTPDCIDWAALSAIAGDHSCSSKQMLDSVLNTDWILVVADVAAQLKIDLARIPAIEGRSQRKAGAGMLSDALQMVDREARNAERTNALRAADTRMQRADFEYATRAGASNAHFLLARARTDMSSEEYAAAALNPGSEVSAIGVYSWFHLSALQKASRLARETLISDQRQALARAALFDEAFALHFLEDAFASGHVAGTWGDASQRKGTHDFYNENGLETFTWTGRSTSVVLTGDAYMRREDAELAAEAVRRSLTQVLDAAFGDPATQVPHTPVAPGRPDDFDVCNDTTLPVRDPGLGPEGRYRAAFEQTLAPTPVPGLGPGLGAMPRFRSELGPFIGLSGTLDGRAISGGFVNSQNDNNGYIGGLELAIRAGLGLEGALGEHSDGLIATSLGFRGDAPSSNGLAHSPIGASGGNLGSVMPARSGLAYRLRMPYYLVPADLLLLSPIYFFNPEAYSRMAVTATNGGLIPWQQGIATRFGRLQFVLGRELGVIWYGLDGDDQLLAPGVDTGATPPRVVNFESTAYELPILEFRPYRSFSANQSSSVTFQLYGGVDVPRGGKVTLPAGSGRVDLDTVWYLGLRMGFDWRYYF